MKLPERLIERIADRIVRELTEEKLIEAEDPELFRKKVLGVFRKAEEEEKELDEKTKEILKEKMNLLEETNLDYRTAFKAVKAKLAEEMKININRRTVEIYEDPPLIRKRVADILRDALREEEEIERRVREKIRQQSKNILEGTPEWNLLYRRIYEDELRQRGLA